MRKATVALAKVTGQMEAIPPEAGESSCDQGLLCHFRQDPMCVYVYICLCIGCRELTHKTIGISLLAILMKRCVVLTYGETPSVADGRAPLPWGSGWPCVFVLTLLCTALCYGMHLFVLLVVAGVKDV